MLTEGVTARSCAGRNQVTFPQLPSSFSLQLPIWVVSPLFASLLVAVGFQHRSGESGRWTETFRFGFGKAWRESGKAKGIREGFAFGLEKKKTKKSFCSYSLASGIIKLSEASRVNFVV